MARFFCIVASMLGVGFLMARIAPALSSAAFVIGGVGITYVMLGALFAGIVAFRATA